MRKYTILSRLLLVLSVALAGSAHAQDPPATPDPSFTKLQADFGVLYRSLSGAGGLTARDRPAVVGFRDRVDAYSAAHPDHAPSVAMALQLSMWLEDQDRVASLYTRLMELRPTDAEIALSRLRHLKEAEGTTDEAMFTAFADLHRRFPDDLDILRTWVNELMRVARYEDVSTVLQAADLDPADAPRLTFLLGDCLFAQHRFAEALSTLEAIPTTSEVNAQIRADVSRVIGYCKDYVELWATEQALREAEKTADDLPRIAIETSRGRIVVELFENQAPNTVANFVKLADTGFYATTRFHRLEPDFMIQGGDPLSKPGEQEKPNPGRPGTGNPGYYIPDEHTLDGNRGHFHDSIAMAKRTEADSAGCQFYFNHRPTPWLNGQHTVFGRVIEGLDVVRTLERDDEIVSMTVLRKRDHPYEPDTIPLATP